MDDAEHTLTSALSTLCMAARPMLCLTVLWHPETRQIGAQFVTADGTLEINRYAPLFLGQDGRQMPLADQRLTRKALQLRRDAQDQLHISPPASSMAIELNGHPLSQPIRVTTEQIDQGAVLALGGAILLCIHWTRTLPAPTGASPLLGVSDAAADLRAQLNQVAASSLPVLLLGETGSGKEVAARMIHAASTQKHGPLVAVNMATLNETLAAADLFGAEKGAYTGLQATRAGYFEEASGGTLFLDEIGDTPSAVQPMLLRVLETGEYRPLGARQQRRSSARLIAATDRDLSSSAFNQPLLRRLEVLPIHVPPLRQRRADIGLLVAAQLARTAAEGRPLPHLPLPLVAQMCLYEWPGNVRQLQNTVTRLQMALQNGNMPKLGLEPAQPPAAPVALAGLKPARNNDTQPAPRLPPALLSSEVILGAMEHCGWNIQRAAQHLHISRPSLYKLLDEHPQIRRPEQIPHEELRATLAVYASDLARCATVLRTPGEALRRFLRNSGMIS